MFSNLWHSATSSTLARRAVLSPSSSSSNSSESTLASSGSTQAATPFTDFVLSRLPDEDSQKLFALSFGEHICHDPDALDINFDDVLSLDRDPTES